METLMRYPSKVVSIARSCGALFRKDGATCHIAPSPMLLSGPAKR